MPSWERTLAWRHLAITIELSICGGDAALCQITLTASIIIIPVIFQQNCSVKMYVIAICCINDAQQKSYRDACNNPLHVF